MHRARLTEIQAREEALDSVMRETEEKRQAALVAASVLDEALGDIRLIYEAHAEDLAQRVEASRGVLNAAAAQERRVSEADASLRVWEEALKAQRKALDGHTSDLERRARSVQESKAAIHWRIEVLDRTHREQEERDRVQVQRAQELEERACALEQREVTLAAHKATAAKFESTLRLHKKATAERSRTTAAAEAAVAHRAEELWL